MLLGVAGVMSQVRSVCIDQCVSAITVMEVPLFIYLCSSCNCDRGRKTIRFVEFALKVFIQNDGDFADVFLLYLVPDIWKIIVPLSSGSCSPRRSATWGKKVCYIGIFVVAGEVSNPIGGGSGRGFVQGSS